jgi:hypothetical protein
MRLRLSQCGRVALLKNLVHGDQGFECLDFVGEDGLPEVCSNQLA